MGERECSTGRESEQDPMHGVTGRGGEGMGCCLYQWVARAGQAASFLNLYMSVSYDMSCSNLLIRSVYVPVLVGY